MPVPAMTGRPPRISGDFVMNVPISIDVALAITLFLSIFSIAYSLSPLFMQNCKSAPAQLRLQGPALLIGGRRSNTLPARPLPSKYYAQVDKNTLNPYNIDALI